MALDICFSKKFLGHAATAGLRGGPLRMTSLKKEPQGRWWWETPTGQENAENSIRDHALWALLAQVPEIFSKEDFVTRWFPLGEPVELDICYQIFT